MARLLAFLLLLTLLAGSLLGCQAPKEEGGKITLEFWTLQLLTFADTLQPIIDEYEAKHPNVKIKWVDVPFSEGEKRTLTSLLSPHVPDVVNLNPDFSAILASRKAVLNMNEAASPEARATYLPVAWKAVSLGDFAFGVPWYLTSSVTIYNRELFQKAGLAQIPASFDALPAFGRTLQERQGNAYALMPSIAESGNFLKELKKVGIEPYDERGRAVFADRGAAKHLRLWVDMYRQRLVPAESLTEGHRASVDRFQAGTLAMLLSGPNFLNIVKENAPEVFKNTNVGPQFPPGGEYVEFSTMLLAVPRKSAHPKEAVDFALFVTNRANQLAFCKKAPVLPSITEALRDPYFQTTDSKDLVERARGISAGQLLRAKQAFQIRPRQNEINEIMNYHVQSALLGKQSPEVALTKAQREINDIIEGG